MKIIYALFLILIQFAAAFDIELGIPQSSALPLETPQSYAVGDSQLLVKKSNPFAENLVYKSSDDGQNWQDISNGLPPDLQDASVPVGFFANETGLHLSVGNEIFHSKPISLAPFWIKETIPAQYSLIAPGKTGIIAFNNHGQFLQKTGGTSVWSPMYSGFRENQVNSVFETAGGAVFIGSNKGLYKSNDSGKTWKQVYSGGWGSQLVESNGVFMATSANGILRSTDGGETWKSVLNEGGACINVVLIKGGFAAINFNTQSQTRRVRATYDGGNTWQAIDAGLPANMDIASIIQVGDNLFCGHPTGIFKSANKGKTWEKILCSVEGKVFSLYSTGNVIYAIPMNGGC